MLELIKGLEALIPNVVFHGDLRTNDQSLYESMNLLMDGIEKPSYAEVYEMALDIYRKEKTEEVNLNTSDMIVNQFKFSVDPSLIFKMDLNFQFNVQTLFSQRDYLTYPYLLKISSDYKGMPMMMSITDVNEFISFQTEAVVHIQTCIHTGVAEKSKIAVMTEEELNIYIDPRS